MPGPRRTLSRDQLRAHLRASVLRPGPFDLVGAEVELTPLAVTGGRVDIGAASAKAEQFWDNLDARRGTSRRLWRGGCYSREPGGQLEISGRAVDTPAEAARVTVRAVRWLRGSARRLGFDWLAVGLHPWASPEEIGLQIETDRYTSMQRHLDAIGPFGRRMMRLTGSVQVNIDFGPGPAREERWELAQRLAPVLTAIFANSRVTCGRPSSICSLRGESWLRLDPGRTGIPPRFLDEPESDPVDQYLDFALSSTVMFIIRSVGAYEMPERPVSFDRWMEEGLASGYPDLADWNAHLSTLFPDVRPRGYLELRAIDAPGVAWLKVPILLSGHALRDPTARRHLIERLRPHHDELLALRERAVRFGLADPTLHDLARAVFRVVRSTLVGPDDALLGSYEERYVQVGRTPGDEMSERIAGGERLDPAALLRLEHERSIEASRRHVSAPILD